MPKPSKTQLAILLAVAVLCFGAGAVYGHQQQSEQAAAALLAPLPESEISPVTPAPANEAGEQEPALIAVHVKGAVERPGIYELPQSSRVGNALDAAGLLDTANTDIVNLAAPLNDGTEVIVPFRVEGEETDWQALAQSTAATNSSGGEAAAAVAGIVNINTAGSTALQSLSGIGPAKAQAIIDYREQHGAFKKIEDIKKVSGIGEATYEKIKASICVE